MKMNHGPTPHPFFKATNKYNLFLIWNKKRHNLKKNTVLRLKLFLKLGNPFILTDKVHKFSFVSWAFSLLTWILSNLPFVSVISLKKIYIIGCVRGYCMMENLGQEQWRMEKGFQYIAAEILLSCYWMGNSKLIIWKGLFMRLNPTI